jgi:type II secretion system protein N
MTRVRKLLYIAAGVPVFIILAWYFAVPDSLIKSNLEDSISNNGKLDASASIKGLKKGLFFTVHADSLELNINKTSAVTITDIKVKINPLYLLKKYFVFSVKAKIREGDIEGSFKLPVRLGESDKSETGALKIDNVNISDIPYLASAGVKGSGMISAVLNLKNNIAEVTFKIPDADIQATLMGMPLPLSSFHKIQGAFQMENNIIRVTTISLEGDRGYARLKGDITNGVMNLVLEIMPAADELKPIESMLGKYQISPGYYVIPIAGPLKQG